MEFSMNTEEKDISFAKAVCEEYKDEHQKSKAFVSALGTAAFKNYLKDCDIQIESDALFRIKKIFELTDIADVFANDVCIDVRTYTNSDALYIPKKHFEDGITPKYYVYALYNEEKQEIIFKGYIPSNNIDKTNQSENYYVINDTKLLPMEELIQAILTEEPKEQNINPDDLSGLFAAFIDNELGKEQDLRVIKLLYNCAEGRKDLISFSQFEFLSCNLANFPTLFDEQETFEDNEQETYKQNEDTETQDISQDEEMPLFEETDDLEFLEAEEENLLEDIEPEETEETENIETTEEKDTSSDNSFSQTLAATGMAGAAFAAGATLGAAATEAMDTLNGVSDITSSAIDAAGSTIETLGDLINNNDTTSDNDDLLSLSEDTEPQTLADDKEETTVFEEEENIQLEETETAEDDFINLDDDIELLEENEPNTDSDEEIDLFDDDNSENNLNEDIDLFEDDNTKINLDEDTDILEDNNTETNFDELNTEEDITFDNEDEELFDVDNETSENELFEISEPEAEIPVIEEENMTEENDFTSLQEESEDNSIETFDDSIENNDFSEDKNEDLISDNDMEDITNLDDFSFEDNSGSEIIEDNTQDNFEFPEVPQIEEEPGENKEDEYDYSDLDSLLNELQPNNNDEVTTQPEEDNQYQFQNLYNEDNPTETVQQIENEHIETLYEQMPELAEVPDELNEEEYAKYVEAPSANTKKNIVIPVVGVVAAVSLLACGGYMISKNLSGKISDTLASYNQQPVSEMQMKSVNDFDDETFLEKSEMELLANNEQNAEGEGITQNPDAPVPNDLNQSISNIFDETIYPVTISKIAWEIPEVYTTSKYFKKYLQIAGVQLQRDLQANLAKVTETSETGKIKISFDINEQSQIKNFKILETSGSKEIDTSVEKSLKNTLSYIKVPVIPSSENFVTLTLVINF